MDHSRSKMHATCLIIIHGLADECSTTELTLLLLFKNDPKYSLNGSGDWKTKIVLSSETSTNAVLLNILSLKSINAFVFKRPHFNVLCKCRYSKKEIFVGMMESCFKSIRLHVFDDVIYLVQMVVR